MIASARPRWRTLRDRLEAWRIRNASAIVLAFTAFCYLFYVPLYENAPKAKANIASPNELSRVLHVIALVEHREWRLNGALRDFWIPRTDLAGVWRVEGKRRRLDLYPGKSPGMAFLVAPFYYVYHQLNEVLGRVPSKQEKIRFCRLVGSTLPAIAFAFVVYLLLGGICHDGYLRNALYLVYVLGTMAFPYALLFVSHAFASGALISAFAILRARPGHGGWRHAWFFVAGLLIGLSYSTEYSAALSGLVLGCYAALAGSDSSGRNGWRGFLLDRRHLVAALLGVIVPVGLTLVYHKAAFGGYFSTAYDFLLNPAFRAVQKTGWHGFVSPRWEFFYGSFLAPSNGLFFFSPLLLLFPLGIYAAFRERRYRLEATLATLWIAIFTLYISSFIPWKAGWTVGPRYIANIVPPMLLLVALGVDRLALSAPMLARGLVVSLGLASIIVTAPPSLIFPHLPDSLQNPLFEATIPLLLHGRFPQNLLGLSPLRAALCYSAVIALAVAYLLAAGRMRLWRRALVAVAALVVIVAAGWQARQWVTPDPQKTVQFLNYVERLSITEPAWGVGSSLAKELIK